MVVRQQSLKILYVTPASHLNRPHAIRLGFLDESVLSKQNHAGIDYLVNDSRQQQQ